MNIVDDLPTSIYKLAELVGEEMEPSPAFRRSCPSAVSSETSGVRVPRHLLGSWHQASSCLCGCYCLFCYDHRSGGDPYLACNPYQVLVALELGDGCDHYRCETRSKPVGRCMVRQKPVAELADAKVGYESESHPAVRIGDQPGDFVLKGNEELASKVSCQPSGFSECRRRPLTLTTNQDNPFRLPYSNIGVS
ncbi:hypothetical protein PMI07_006409 [Rhizobium sp. CF080]|nr:hypothetical protein PMI07_006409 [Rhizobium sp. CF080]